MKNIVIVNENDEVIGEAPYSQKGNLPDGVYGRATALWVVNSQNQVLIAQRTFSKKIYPGKWGMSVAGTVESGETYESNAYKEAEEEVSLAGFEFTELYKTKRINFMMVYGVRCDWPIEKYVKQDEEVEELKFVNLPELLDDATANPDNYIKDFAGLVSDLKKIIDEGRL